MQTVTKLFRNTLTIAILILTVSAFNAAAATFTVTNTNDSGAGSLQQAILNANAAAGADTIVFDAGVFSTPQTIVLAGTVLTINDVGNAALTINGPGANLLTVSGNNVVRVFEISSGDTASISGMTITQGNSMTGSSPGIGGAIYTQGTLTVDNVVVTGNSATTDGGGIYGTGSNLTVTNSTITSNTAVGNSGGGIYVSSISSLTVTNSTISNNTAVGNTSVSNGGGLFINNTPSSTLNNVTVTGNTSASDGGGIAYFGNRFQLLTIINSVISNNRTTPGDGFGTGRGGGLYYQQAALTIRNTLITGNSAVVHGGGIAGVIGEATTITDSTISNNTANSDRAGLSFNGGNGGGLYFTDGPPATITNSTISGNMSLLTTGRTDAGIGVGGGIFLSQKALNLTNSTVSGNTAGLDGGGIFESSGNLTTNVVTITSSTIVNNTATRNGGGIVNDTNVGENSVRNTIVANNSGNVTSPDIFGTIMSQGFNLIENTTGATITGDTATNITGQDPNLGALQNNGGLTFTHALLAGSPAIDKGNSFGLTTDQRGAMRPYDNPSIPNAADGADIGAFELQAPTAATATIGGRVTAGGRRGVSGAVVRLTDQNGNVRIAPTDLRGNFQFEDVAVGETFVLSVFSKQYQFTPQIISVNENITDLNFTAH